MSPQTPPPLPDSDTALRIYLRAGFFLIPSAFVWSFAAVFLVPKLRQIWQLAGLDGSKIQWLLDIGNGFQQQFPLALVALVLVTLVLEFRWPAWPRYRRTSVAGVTLLIHTAVLTGITAIAVAVCISAPLLTRKS